MADHHKNVHVCLMGHVDSGKTSLAKALSSVASTASFDKNPQSQERGITIDLGFSSFTIPQDQENVHITLVDCPGHASFMRTVIGGASIMEAMFLVIDATKGIQTQTAECLVLGELLTPRLIVLLNKVDALSPQRLDKVRQRIEKVLSTSSFASFDVLTVSAKQFTEDMRQAIHQALLHSLDQFPISPKNIHAPFVMAVDHCFSIKGRGTILTGSVLQGTCDVGDVIDIPTIGETRVVKSMQVFRKDVSSVQAGDRLGMCITKFPSDAMERGVVGAPGALSFFQSFYVSNFAKIRYFTFPVKHGQLYHISMGHATTMGTLVLFDKRTMTLWPGDVDGTEEHLGIYIMLASSVYCEESALVIASRFDFDLHAKTCRFAFHGRVSQPGADKPSLVRHKVRTGTIERVVNPTTVICKELFRSAQEIQAYVGQSVQVHIDEQVHSGKILGTFGQSHAKFKVGFTGALPLQPGMSIEMTDVHIVKL